jgi:predicted DNA-binding transcriptional regulator AlpA
MRLLSKKKVCERLSISPATLARWEANPELDFPKRYAIGGNGAWKREDAVDDWIDTQTTH